jgi:hypothetical protein
MGRYISDDIKENGFTGPYTKPPENNSNTHRISTVATSYHTQIKLH